MAAKSLTTLLAGIVDYAGLFPPAALTMREAVRNFAEYKKSSDAWMLERFIVPIARLDEFEREAEPFLPKDSSPWRISALGGTQLQNDANAIMEFNARSVGAIIDSVEVKVMCVEEILAAATVFPKSLQTFVEIPIQQSVGELVGAIADARLKAKVRTGGVTADAFPSSEQLVRFMHACVQANAQFKATAGLHHPIRAMYNLTYTLDSERGKMFGYMNVFLAAAFLKNGLSFEDAKRMLEEEHLAAFQFDDESVRWNSFSLTVEQLREARRTSALTFGSCSFREPIDDLRAASYL